MLVNNKIPVLMVDDHPENLVALEALLSEMPVGLDLVRALSGNAALRLCLKHEFAVILLDVQMPEMTGLETAELLRANPKTKHIPIVFVTAGMNEQSQIFAGYESGAVDYLIKPIEPLVLRSKVQVFCALYAQRKEIEYHQDNLEGLIHERTAELKELTNSLELRVQERTMELRRTLNEIVESEKLASLGRIVAGVAHELNTPIGNIVLVDSTLSDRIKDLSRDAGSGKLSKSQLTTYLEEYKEAVCAIARSAERASELIESFKQIAIDQTSQRRRVFDLRQIVQDVLATLGTQMRHARATADIRIPAGIKMDGVPGDLEQIFTNLVLNSIRHGFSEAGRGCITIDAEERQHQLTITYRDDGIGIAPEFHDKVFEPFYTTKLGQGGSGLGMYIVHNIVRGALKGEITLRSEARKGVEFSIRIPVPPA